MIMFPIDDTITAQASARGSGLRGIIRISGPAAVDSLQTWFRYQVENEEYRVFEAAAKPAVVHGELVIWGTEIPIPCLLYYWPEGRGFTGQQSVELHMIGSQPILEATIAAICRTGCRLAGPGEFTLRAFLSGRIDLPQAEAVLGVIDAHNQQQLDVALKQLAGGVGRPLAALRERLLEMLCHLEAEFDFADEEIEFLDRDQLKQELHAALDQIGQTQQQMHERTSTVELQRVVLIGRPNAGKSSLFNAIIKLMCDDASANQPSAIVSPIPGTTRDYLEARISVGNRPFLLVDTAGIEETSELEFDEQPRHLAQSFTRTMIDEAALVLLCVEANESLTEDEIAFCQANADRTVIVQTKSDRETPIVLPPNIDAETCSTSATMGTGIKLLLDRIANELQKNDVQSDVVPATAARCHESLHHAAESLRNALALSETLRDELLIATELRVALEHIGQMVGAVHNDEILDRIFSQFCIGK